MALRASTLVDGEWTTTTFDVDHVLRAHNRKQEAPSLMDVEKPPTLGILTQTVIRSPLVHWILPVRLRGPDIHDVAFIGVRNLPCLVLLHVIFSPIALFCISLQVRFYTYISQQPHYALDEVAASTIYVAGALISIG